MERAHILRRIFEHTLENDPILVVGKDVERVLPDQMNLPVIFVPIPEKRDLLALCVINVS